MWSRDESTQSPHPIHTPSVLHIASDHLIDIRISRLTWHFFSRTPSTCVDIAATSGRGLALQSRCRQFETARAHM